MNKLTKIVTIVLAVVMIFSAVACAAPAATEAPAQATSPAGSQATQQPAATEVPAQATTAPAAPADQKPVKIAVAGPMTGDNSEYGIGFFNAVTLMAEQWNAKGGINGRKIEVVQFDDKNSPEEAVSVANKIVSEKDIPFIIGHFASGVSMAAAPIYQANKIIEISPSASHPDYSSIGDYIFRNNTVIKYETQASLDIAVNDMGKKNIGIISIKTDWGVSTSKIATELIAGMDDKGVKLVAHEEVIEGSDDYRPAITKLNDAGADVVLCVGMYGLVAPVAKQYKEINPNISIIAFSNAYSQQLLELGGDAVNGVAFPVVFFSVSSDPNIQAFVKSYTDKFGSAPSALTAQAYDSAGILFTAAQKVGTDDPAKLRDEVNSMTYPGVTGSTHFDQNGDVQKPFTKVEVEDGKFVLMGSK